ncbi:MAG: hypothetical protein CMP23_14320 [Rickettsiales bacterium]|nr:hypothetical protein [Rickettsiales bacterium]
MPQLPPSIDSIRWVPGQGNHVESFFLKANNPKRPEQAFWLKFTLLDPGSAGTALAEVWAIRFAAAGGPHQAAKLSRPASQAQLSSSQIGFLLGDCQLQPGQTQGRVLGREMEISWDLQFDYRNQRVMYGLPHRWMYDAAFPRNKVYSSCPNTRFRGRFTVADENWEVKDWPGMLGHNWGKAHNPRYHWAQCNLFEPEDCVFEAWSARIQLGPWLSPWLTGATARLDGEELSFNAVHKVLNRSLRFSPLNWSFETQHQDWRLRWQVSAPAADFAGLRYLNPDGQQNFCLNSKIASCRLELWNRQGGRWQPRAQLKGERSCAYEILVPDNPFDIPILA